MTTKRGGQQAEGFSAKEEGLVVVDSSVLIAEGGIKQLNGNQNTIKSKKKRIESKN